MTTSNLPTRQRGPDVGPRAVAEIRRLRLEEGLSVAEVSRRTGIHPATVSDYAPVRGPAADARHQAALRRVVAGEMQKAVALDLGLSLAAVSRLVRRARAAGTLPLPDAPGAAGASYEIAGTVEPRQDEPPAPGPGATTVAADIRSASLRARVLRVACEAGPLDTNDLAAALRRTDGATNFDGHELQHILASLERQGLVSYRTNRNGRRKLYSRIVGTPRGYAAAGLPPRPAIEPSPERPRDYTNPRAHGVRAVGGPIERLTAAATALVGGPVELAGEAAQLADLASTIDGPAARAWPVLDALRLRRDRGERRATLLRQAADLADDPDERDELEAHAELAGDPGLTPTEREYLAYALRYPATVAVASSGTFAAAAPEARS